MFFACIVLFWIFLCIVHDDYAQLMASNLLHSVVTFQTLTHVGEVVLSTAGKLAVLRFYYWLLYPYSISLDKGMVIIYNVKGGWNL